MKHLLKLAFAGLLMIVVILGFAFTTMRLAIHGSQVEVPSLVGLTVDEAERRVASRGLNLQLVSRFYSTTVPAGHIISQVPAPGVIVRQEWEVRTIESLGPQRVSIPDVRGMPERPAAITIRRLSLDLGTQAHLPFAGPVDVVLAQTPPPNAAGVDSPRLNLLLSQQEEGEAFVMPSLIGLPLSTATSRAAALGVAVSVSGGAAGPAAPTSPDAMVVGDAPPPAPAQTVSGQSPPSGHRVARGESIRLTVGSPERAGP